jgi:hypothetical protein
MKNMKMKREDIDTLGPGAKGNTNVGEAKSEFTFMWTEAEEWKPTREAHEIAEDANSPSS